MKGMSEIDITKKDKDILFELSLNARASLTELSKKVKLSKQVVSYRLKLLEKNKIISGYYAITNPYALGMAHYRVFVKYHNMSSEKETEFMEYLAKHPKVTWIAYFDGSLDAAFIIWAKSIFEFQEVYDEINERFGEYLQEKFFSIATKIQYLKYKFLNNSQDTRSVEFVNPDKIYVLDNLDKDLLKELNLNGRVTLVELANKFSTSAKVIKFRIERLVKRKIIIGFNIKIDHNKLSFSHRKVLLKLNNVSTQKINRIINYLQSLSNSIYIIRPMGDYDLEFELMTRSNEEFHDLIKELRSRFADDIKSYDTVIHYSEPKSGQLFEI